MARGERRHRLLQQTFVGLSANVRRVINLAESGAILKLGRIRVANLEKVGSEPSDEGLEEYMDAFGDDDSIDVTHDAVGYVPEAAYADLEQGDEDDGDNEAEDSGEPGVDRPATVWVRDIRVEDLGTRATPRARYRVGNGESASSNGRCKVKLSKKCLLAISFRHPSSLHAGGFTYSESNETDD